MSNQINVTSELSISTLPRRGVYIADLRRMLKQCAAVNAEETKSVAATFARRPTDEWTAEELRLVVEALRTVEQRTTLVRDHIALAIQLDGRQEAHRLVVEVALKSLATREPAVTASA